MSWRGGRGAVTIRPALHDLRPPERGSHPALAGGPKASRQRRLAGKPLQGAREHFRIRRRHEQPAFLIFDDVRDPTCAAADHWNPAAHGLKEHDTQAFGVAPGIDDRRQHQNVGGGKGVPQIFIVDAPPKVDAAVGGP